MKKILLAATFALFASTQTFAIIGLGAHYIMNTGSLGSSAGAFNNSINISSVPGGPVPITINVDQEKAEGLKGLGFKLWIDFLPFVDIEGTFNIAATRYKTSLTFVDPTGTITLPSISLSYPVEAPYNALFDNASPIYGVASGDVSITYPFDVLPIIRPYVGVGLSYFISTPVVNAAFFEHNATLVEKIVTMDPNDPAGVEGIKDAVIDALKHSDYESGMGGHIIAGVRIKPPILPFAVYTNGKYYFGGNTDSKFSQGFVLEVGGGFAL